MALFGPIKAQNVLPGVWTKGHGEKDIFATRKRFSVKRNVPANQKKSQKKKFTSQLEIEPLCKNHFTF